MEEAWLSVIVPSHNGQRWLSTALQSIADQRECGIEVIVIDSSTEDTSLAIAESFSAQFVIRALRRPDLLPWMAKTNFGVEQAKGKWICMLHQDDLWLKPVGRVTKLAVEPARRRNASPSLLYRR
jgi:glycosyltransferase involved in cell wall biosynthesis